MNFCDKLKSVSKSKNNNEFLHTIYEHMRRACTTFERVAADGTRRSFFSCCVCEWLICPVIYKARQIMVLEKSRTIPSLYVDTFLSTARLRLVAVRCDVGLKCDGNYPSESVTFVRQRPTDPPTGMDNGS